MSFIAIEEAAGVCPPPKPYSHAIRTNSTIYLAGQVSLDKSGSVAGKTPAEQARQVWRNMSLVLQAAGASISDFFKVTYYMQDVREIAEEIEIRKEIFIGRPFPVVTAIRAAALGLPGLRMEVDVIAVVSE